jgi:beta-galactosidase
MMTSCNQRRAASAVLVFLLTAAAPAFGRSTLPLRDTWKFMPSNMLTGVEAIDYDDSSWASVTVPHTWDSVQGVTRYTSSWYRTHFTVHADAAGDRVYLYFEGVFQVADVYVNGQHLGQHRGGYTRFIFDATTVITFDADNVLAVKVSNALCNDCLPDGTPRLFKGYGGIYRNAWCVTTSMYQVATTDFATSGVYITPFNVGSDSANVSIRTLVTNNDRVDRTLTVGSRLVDADENTVLDVQQDVLVPAAATIDVTQSGTVRYPHLWGPGDPYLYTVHTTVRVDGAVTDAVDEHTGFRFYRLTANDFTLNGAPLKLRGVSKHQETEYRANAVSDADLATDWDNLQDLGVNFVRLVHYPHAALEYTLADQRGLLVWAENGQTNGGPPTANGNTINLEMVYQNYNHPSIVFWSAGNESSAVPAVSQYAQVIASADSSRPVVYASNGQTPANVDYIFHNIYPGWYGGSMYNWNTSSFRWISESGAGMVIATQNADYFNGVFRVDAYEPEQYGALNNEVKFQDLFVSNPAHVPAFSNWVFRDFSDNKYKRIINTKGLVTFSNYKKDIYYLYRSFLRPADPVIRIAGPHYFLRSANPAGQGDVKVYSNAPVLTLTVNGVSKGTQTNGSYAHPNGTVINNVFYWSDVLVSGRNDISATDDTGRSDAATLYYKADGQTMPAEDGAKVVNVVSDNLPAFFIGIPLRDQYPFYGDFDGTGDNTFDMVPSELSGAVGWVTTARQSDPTKASNISFDLTADADVYLMFTKQAVTPAWIVESGFTDTMISGQWRNNDIKLVDYQLYKRTFTAGSHVDLGSSAIDFLIIVK